MFRSAFVLVETKQSSPPSPRREYLAEWLPLAECHVHAVCPDGYSFRQRLHHQYRNMICRFFFHLFHYNRSLLYALIACLCFFLSQVFPLPEYLAAFAEFPVHKGLCSAFLRPDFDGAVHADKAYPHLVCPLLPGMLRQQDASARRNHDFRIAYKLSENLLVFRIPFVQPLPELVCVLNQTLG